MSQSIQEMVDVVEKNGDHVYVLTKGDKLSNTDVLQPLLLCYLIIWPFISMIVAFLVFSK